MRKFRIYNFDSLTTQRVIAHAIYRRSKGLRPSMSFCDIRNPRKALKSAFLIRRINIVKAPQVPIRCGFEYHEFTMQALLFSQWFPVIIRNREVELQLNFGRLHFKAGSTDLQLKETYLAEVNTGISTRHARYLSLGGFGTCLFQDYAEAGRELVRRFSESLGLRICNELNHWPDLKIVVSK